MNHVEESQIGDDGHNGHQLKIEPGHFRDVQLGLKRAEVRRDDRGFRVGDHVVLREYHDHFGYIGGVITARISHILTGGYGLQPGFVVLSLRGVVVHAVGKVDPLDDGEPPDPNDERRIEDLT